MFNEPDMMDDGEQPEKSARTELHASILADITSRAAWETKQVDYYRMRHQGIRRKQKPWNNAADLHFPLIDTNIEKLKPLFFDQITGRDTVASFVPMRQQLQAATTTAERWFDYKIRERSNFQTEGLSWIDYSLMAGRACIKITWNPTKRQIEYTAVDPMYLIVPAYTKLLDNADRVVHVMPMSLAAYKRAGVYDTSAETIKRITSQTDDSNIPGVNQENSAKRVREGITHDTNKNHVIVWEVYELGDDRNWTVKTYSPAAPEINLREPMMLPYEHNMAPFVDYAYEIKDGGWYSPRGIAEILAPFEAALCHMWNQKHDAIQLFNKPVFRAERDMPNTMNLRVAPGQILPNGLIPVAMPPPPLSFDDDMNQTRSIAEQRVANPDFGLNQAQESSDRRTATEIKAIGAQSMKAGDLRARMFRASLGRAYKQSWALLMQFDSEDLQYRFQEESQQVDIVALHNDYHIEPKGGVNEVDRETLLQRAIQRKALFKESPWINQPEIDKSILELDDPALIKRVFQDPNQQGQQEQSQEAVNIPALLLGASIPVKQGDNYALRIGVLMQFSQQQVQQGGRFPPMGQKALLTRLDALLQANAQVDNNGGKQLAKNVQAYLQSVGLIPPQQPGMAPGMPPAPPMPAAA
jgi:hypothetical protein